VDLVLKFPAFDKFDPTQKTHIPRDTLAQACTALPDEQHSVSVEAGGKFFLEQIPLSEVNEARIFPNSRCLEWISPNSGIPGSVLTHTDLNMLRSELTSDMVHYVAKALYDCSLCEVPEDRITDCQAGMYLRNTYLYQLEEPHTNYSLQITFRDGQQTAIHIHRHATGVVFVGQDGSHGIEGLVRGATPIFDSLLSTHQETPMAILWPELTADEANALAAWLWGRVYQRVLDYTQTISDSKVRPAVGENHIPGIADESPAVFTLLIDNPKNNSIARVEGFMISWENRLFSNKQYWDHPLIWGEIIGSGLEHSDFSYYPDNFIPWFDDMDSSILLALRHLVVAGFCRLKDR
jgi:hypothetical protein